MCERDDDWYNVESAVVTIQPPYHLKDTGMSLPLRVMITMLLTVQLLCSIRPLLPFLLSGASAHVLAEPNTMLAACTGVAGRDLRMLCTCALHGQPKQGGILYVRLCLP